MLRRCIAYGARLEDSLRTVLLRHADMLFVVGITVLALAARMLVFQYESLDYTKFLNSWYIKIATEGFAAFKTEFSDYAMPYLYLLYAGTKLGLPALTAIKLISIICDFVLAFFAARSVYVVTGQRLRALYAYGVILCLPTVWLNGAAWGQCDAVFASFIVMTMYYCLVQQYMRCMLAYSIAFCFKFQAVFVLPVLAVLAVQGAFSLCALLLPPLMYILFQAPPLVVGAEVSTLFFKTFIRQADQYRILAPNAPTLWSVFGASGYRVGGGAVCIALAFVTTATFACVRAVRPLGTNLPLAFAFFATFVPFVLPRMHERYFFLADVFTLVYAFTRPQRFFVPVLVVMGSLISYQPFLIDAGPFPLYLTTIAMGTAVAFLAADMYLHYGGPAESGPSTAA